MYRAHLDAQHPAELLRAGVLPGRRSASASAPTSARWAACRTSRSSRPGLVCVAAMNGASFEVTYNVFVRLNFEKTYDAMLTTPIEPDDVLAGEMLWAMTRAAIYGGASSRGRCAVRPRAAAARAAGAAGRSRSRACCSRRSASRSRCASRRIDLFSFYFTLFLTPLFLFSDVFFPLEERLSRRLALASPRCCRCCTRCASRAAPSAASCVAAAPLGRRLHRSAFAAALLLWSRRRVIRARLRG